jgi:GDP-D-mannose 3',5'-epimerase
VLPDTTIYFGPYGSWCDGREKAPAAICRKVAEAKNGGSIEIWGDGEQTRSFMYIDECLEATTRFTRSEWSGPVNIGSDEMVSINQLARMAMLLAGKELHIKNIPGPLGVRGRNSHNELYEKMLGWKPDQPLLKGLEVTYPWVEKMVKHSPIPEN